MTDIVIELSAVSLSIMTEKRVRKCDYVVNKVFQNILGLLQIKIEQRLLANVHQLVACVKQLHPAEPRL